MNSVDTGLVAKLRSALGSRYAVGAEIGRGGMSIVYRARDFDEERDVAVKILRPELAATIAVDRFLREVQIAKRLEHDGILPVFESGDVDGCPYYVMPFIHGESLRSRLDRERQLEIGDALRIATDVARILEYAHSRGVVHRDVKPENILLADGAVIVSDFGIAHAVVAAGGKTLTDSGVTLGTPAYLSPEQAGTASRVDARTDVYALGCVLYEMLAGEPPFTGPTPQVVVARHLAEQPRSLRIVRSAVEPELDEVIRRALAKVPADRFPTTAAFAEALELVGSATRLRKLRARRRFARLAAGTALVTATAFGAWSAFFGTAPDLDGSRVVVFPLRETGVAAPGTGYDVALMIGAALEHTDPLKWIDGHHYLDADSRLDPRLVTLRKASEISRARNARHFLEGAVRQDSDSATVVLRLHDVAGDSIVAQESATGPASMPAYQLALASIRLLLPQLVDPGREVDLAVLSERRPAAIALWIQGERAYRRTRFAPALDFYKRAVREDSALAFAALKGAQAANWIVLREDARDLVRIALARESTLPPRYRAFARGLEAFLAAEPDTAVFWLERARAADSDWAEAATALGEVYYHLFPAGASLDSLAESAFESALRSDSLFTPPMLHLIEIVARKGDTGRARELVDRLRAGEPDTMLTRQRLLMVECLEGGPDAIDWAAAARENTIAVLLTGQQFSVGAAQPKCAEAAFRGVLSVIDSTGYRWAALLGLHGVLAAQRRVPELVALLDSAIAAGTSQALFLYVIDLFAGLPVEQNAAAMEAQARQRFGEGYSGASPHVLWLLGLWHASRGNEHQVEKLSAALAAEASQTNDRRTRLLSHALRAHAELASGDTAQAIAELLRLSPNARVVELLWDIFDPLAVERITLARLLLERGRWEEAERVAAGFDHPEPAIYPVFVPASLEIRRTAAQALGRNEKVGEYTRRLDELKRR